MNSLKIINDIATMLSNYKTTLSYYLDEEFGKMTVDEIKNSEDNLETAVGALLGEIEKIDNCISGIKQIEQILNEILLLKEILKKHLFVLKEKGISFERMWLILSEYEDKNSFDFLKTYATKRGDLNY